MEQDARTHPIAYSQRQLLILHLVRAGYDMRGDVGLKC